MVSRGVRPQRVLTAESPLDKCLCALLSTCTQDTRIYIPYVLSVLNFVFLLVGNILSSYSLDISCLLIGQKYSVFLLVGYILSYHRFEISCLLIGWNPHTLANGGWIEDEIKK